MLERIISILSLILKNVNYIFQSLNPIPVCYVLKHVIMNSFSRGSTPSPAPSVSVRERRHVRGGRRGRAALRVPRAAAAAAVRAGRGRHRREGRHGRRRAGAAAAAAGAGAGRRRRLVRHPQAAVRQGRRAGQPGVLAERVVPPGLQRGVRRRARLHAGGVPAAQGPRLQQPHVRCRHPCRGRGRARAADT